MNYIEKVVKMVGLQLGEEFQLKQGDTLEPDFYKFDLDGLKFKSESGQWKLSVSDAFTNIILGVYEVFKCPYKPKYGEEYWTYTNYGEDFVPYQHIWVGSTFNYLCYYAGLVYRTQEECEAHAEENFKRIISSYNKDEVKNNE